MPSGKHGETLVRMPEDKGLSEPLFFNRRFISGAHRIESMSHECDMEQGGGWAGKQNSYRHGIAACTYVDSVNAAVPVITRSSARSVLGEVR
jgi:hypothetical protein